MNKPHSELYDLRITLLDSVNWQYKDLYFHFYRCDIADKWIINFLKLKSSDHSFRHRESLLGGVGVDTDAAISALVSVIHDINAQYDIVLPCCQEFTQENLNELHKYFEEYGQRMDFKKTIDLSDYFNELNVWIHRLEHILGGRNQNFRMMMQISFSPRLDFELTKDDLAAVLPIIEFGEIYLGYNTLGRNLHQAVNAKDQQLIAGHGLSPQQCWSNEILLSLGDFGNKTQQLLRDRRKWKMCDIDRWYRFGDFAKNVEGYVPLATLINEQKDHLSSHSAGVDAGLSRFNRIHSVDLVHSRGKRNIEDRKRIPVWKYPVKVQGPKINEIHNQGTVYITWLLNNICNYACRYCPDVLHNGKNVKHDWHMLEPFVDHLNVFYQDKNINFAFTGGEPTLSPFFPTMVKKIYELGHRSGITTNLSRTNRYIGENFIYLDYVSCSFHPAYEFVNNTADAYIEKLKLSSEITSTSCRIMMDPNHWDQCIAFIDQLIRLESIAIQPVMIDPQYGYSSKIIENITYTDAQIDWFSQFHFEKKYVKPKNALHRVKTNFSQAVFDTLEKETIVDPQQYINRGQTNFWNYRCNIGRESLFINHDGKIQRANCGISGIAGTLDNWKEIPWDRLKESVSCTSVMCHCGTDVLISKKRIER